MKNPINYSDLWPLVFALNPQFPICLKPWKAGKTQSYTKDKMNSELECLTLIMGCDGKLCNSMCIGL